MAKTLHYDFLTNPTLTGSEHPVATSPTLSITRATKATMVDADGYIREVQSGEARFTGATWQENLLPYTDFQSGQWTDLRATTTTGAADPNGGTSAVKVVDSTDNNTHFVYYTFVGNNQDASQVARLFSVYAKAGALSHIAISYDSLATVGAWFNLSTGAVGTEVNVDDAGIESIGDGWYRCWILGTRDTSTVPIIFIADNETASYTGNGTDEVYLWHPQWERAEGRSPMGPGTFIETTGTVKSSLTGTSTKGLLVEEARTNICLQSEDFTTTWTSNNTGTVSNATTAPDGSSTADRLIDNSAGGTGAVYESQAVTVLTSTAYTFSIFAKADQLNFLALRFLNFTTPADPSVWFNVSTGSVGTTGSGLAASIEDYGSGWYRCIVTFTTDSTDTAGEIRVTIDDADNGGLTVPLDGTSSIFIWGAQLEASPGGPSSYIPTTTTSVTRNGDLPVTTDLSWYNIVEGSFYTKATYEGVQGGPAAATSQNYIFSLDDGTATDRIINWLNQATTVDAGGTSIARVMSNNSVQAQPFESRSSTVYGIGVETKSALGVKKDDFAMYIGGSEVSFGSPDTSGNMPQDELTTFRIGHRYSDDFHFNGHIAEIAYFNERLANATLADYSLNGLPTAFPGTVAGDGGHIWPARSNDPRWAQIITDSGITTTGNFIDDVHQALEAMASDTGAMDDLWKKVKAIYSITDTSEPFTY